jgi:hypothetical protein
MKKVYPILLLAGCATLVACVSPVTRQSQDSVTTVARKECHPAPDFARDQYIIGYGSLMNEASKKRTAPNAGPGLPIRVEGFRREWTARGAPIGFSTTFLGVAASPEASMNAVVYKVDDDTEVMATDRRERQYCRHRVAPNQLTMLSGATKPDGEMWVYVNKDDYRFPPSKRWPIVQSYVDIFLGGCLALEEKYGVENFAAECVTSTHGWSKHWVNDRIYPRRPFIHQKQAWKIDRLLHKQIPETFKQIRIE